MPRRSTAAVADTRAEVLDVAVLRASVDGLEGLTIGRLADELSMSKSGLHGLFGSKEELQVATFEQAVEGFTRDVWLPVARRQPGLPRLLALLDRWLAYHRRRVLPGGCLVTTATIEFDARPGLLRDAVARARQYLGEYQPSSPSMALLRDGEVVHFVHRHQIEGRSPQTIAAELATAFDRFFGAAV